jgi:hypothetical protein
MYISVLSLEIQLSEGAVWDSIDRFDTRQNVVPFQYQNMDFHHQTSCFVYVQEFGVRGVGSFC